jgi:hypothetical protein
MGGCEARVEDGSTLAPIVDGVEYEVVPIDQANIEANNKNLLIDLRRPERVYVIDGSASREALIETPLVCPNGMQTNVADFLIGQAVAFGDRGTVFVVGSASEAVLQSIVGDLPIPCHLECGRCPDGAIVCLPEGDCGEGESSDDGGPGPLGVLQSLWMQQHMDDDSAHGDERTDIPGWSGPPPSGDPSPYGTPDDGFDPGGGGFDPGGGGGFDPGNPGGGGGGGGNGSGGGGDDGGQPDYY